ncbi:MAG: hypothetical protein WCP20_21275 [Desulfuromonadales bacterium]
MHRGEIDGRWWTIPGEAIYTAQAKNHVTHRVYLTDTALELIGDTTGKGYIFPCPHGAKQQPIDTRALAHAVRRNLRWPVLHKGKLMAKCKIGLEHRDRVLNHKKEKLDGTYNQHDFDDEKQAALETIERKIKSIISGKENNVIPIAAGRKAA